MQKQKTTTTKQILRLPWSTICSCDRSNIGEDPGDKVGFSPFVPFLPTLSQSRTPYTKSPYLIGPFEGGLQRASPRGGKCLIIYFTLSTESELLTHLPLKSMWQVMAEPEDFWSVLSHSLHCLWKPRGKSEASGEIAWLPNTHRPLLQGHGLKTQSHRLAQGSLRPSPLTRTAAEKSRQCRDSSGHGKASCGSVPRPQGCSGDSPSLSRHHTSESHAEHL